TAAARTDLPQTNILGAVGDLDHAQVAGRSGGGAGVARGGPAGADKGDLAGAAAILTLHVARKRQGLIEIQRSGTWLGGTDRGVELLAVKLERRGRCGQRVSANQHHAIVSRERF